MIDGWLTLLPPLVAIAFVFWRREVVTALIIGLFTSEWLLAINQGSYSPFKGFISAIERQISVLNDAGNARLIVFSLLIGAVLAFMQYSGGVAALVQKLVSSGFASNARRSGLLSFFTGVVVFIESNLSVLSAGILSRGLFDRFGMSRARLAYIIDSTSAPICILILLNGWGAFILGIISEFAVDQSPVSILIATIPLNIYALTTLIVVFYTVWTGRVHGALKRHEQSQKQHSITPSESIEVGRARDMIIPLLVLVVAMLLFMLWTGNGDIMAGSGSKSVLYATVLAIVVGFLLLIQQERFAYRQVVEMGFKGIADVLPLVAILFLSIGLGASVRELGTGVFISGLVADYLPLFMVPAVVFLAGAFASFSTGTSWGTFALLVPIAMPISAELNLPPSLILAAVLGGGIFGDHSSPLSDTTAVSSLAAGSDLLDHVRTQMPYALVCGGVSFIAYVFLGWWMI